jgi:hypothetical protein
MPRLDDALDAINRGEVVARNTWALALQDAMAAVQADPTVSDSVKKVLGLLCGQPGGK